MKSTPQAPMPWQSMASLAVAALGIVTGLALRVMEPLKDKAAYGCLAVGGAALVAFIALERKEIKRLAGGRTAMYGGNALAYSLLVLGILVLVNWVAARHPERLDLTNEKIYTLSEQSLKILGGLGRDVTISFVPTEDTGNPQTVMLNRRATELLRVYERSSTHVKTDVIDYRQDPLKVEKLGVRAPGSMVLQSGSQKDTITATSEESITNAIFKVSRDKSLKIYFIEGHGERSPEETTERGLSFAKDSLTAKSFTVATLSLSSLSEVPRDASVVCIADPERQLGEKELDVLKRYLAEGGRALLMLDYTHDGGLPSVLSDYGMELKNDLVIEQGVRLQGAGAETVLVQAGRYPFHPITQHFPFDTVFPIVRSVLAVEKPPASVTLRPLLQTTEAGYAERDLENLESGLDEATDKKGPVSFALAATWKPTEQKDAAPASKSRFGEGRMVVMGDSDWASNMILPLPGSGNEPLLVNIAGWLSETEALIAVPAKKAATTHITLSASEGLALALLAGLVIPGGVGVIGAITWLRRRRL